MNGPGLIIALPQEARGLGLRLPVGAPSVRVGTARVAVSGAGAENARRTAERLLDEGACALISWGCAAALSPELAPGALLLAEYVYPAAGAPLPVDPHWRRAIAAALTSRGIPLQPGDLLESATIVATAADKHTLATQTRAAALDMESVAIARVALARDCPFVAVRAIADDASMSLPTSVLRATAADGTVRMPHLLSSLFKHPNEIPSLIRLGLAFGAALRSLRAAHQALGTNFCLPATP